MTKTIATLILSIIFCLSASAQQEMRHMFTQISVNDGLPQNTISSIMQDKNGIMWIATTGGLARYDSYSFDTYHPSNHKTNCLASDAISALCRDSKGRMWIATDKGLSLYNSDKCNFSNFVYRKHSSITDIVELDSMHLLLNASGEMVMFNTTDYQFRKLGLCRLNIKGVSELFRYGDIVYIAHNRGVMAYNTKNYRLWSLPIKGIAGSDIKTIFRAAPAKLYVGTEGNGLFCYNLTTHETQHLTKQNSRLCSNYIRTIADDEMGNVWVGTVSGLNIIGQDGVPICTDATTIDGISLTSTSVRCIARDKQGGMWVGTFFDGVCYYNPRKNHFVNIQNIPGVNSLSNNIIGCIAEDSSHNLWIGTNGGLHYYNPYTHHFNLLTTANGLLSNDIKAMYIDQKSNVMYVGSQLGGLAIVNLSNHNIRSIRMKSNVADDNSIYAIHPLGGGKLLIGSLTGLKLYDKATSTITPLPKNMRGDYRYPQRVRSIYCDRKGKLWIGGEDGLYTYILKGGSMRRVALPEAYEKMRHNCVNTIAADHKGNVWVGTQQGAYVFLPNNKVKAYTKDNGMPGNMVYAFLEDSMGKMWLSTNRGLCTFRPERDNYKYYTVKDGLPNNLFMPNAALKTHDGIMYFGSINGIASFHPEQFTDNPYAPEPIIAELRLYDNVVMPGDENDILSVDITHTKRITLRHNQTNISLRMSVPNYLSGGHNTFAYKLEGYDNEWRYTSDTQIADYSYIPAGTYRFLVRAANNDGKWNNATTKLTIKVLPPWYATWIAKLVYLLLIIGTIYGVFRFLLEREKQEQKAIREHKEQEHKQEMYEMRQRFFIDISHELRTPLTLITSPLDEIMSRQRDGWTKTRLHLIQKNVNRLVHLVNQLMDYRRAELNVFKLKVRPIQLAALIEKNYALYQESAEKRGISYKWSCNDGGKPTLCDPNYVELILNNLISNAFKYTPDGKSITIVATADDNTLHLAVQDTGLGIPEEKKQRIFERFYQLNGKQTGGWGIGLSIVTRLVELHHGTMSVDSTLGEGSTFGVTLPANADAYTVEETATEDEIHNNEIENLYKDITPYDGKDNQNADNDNAEEEETDKNIQDEEKATVLVTDDNNEIRHYLCQSLSNEYNVLEACNGKEALEVLAQNEVNIILSDVMMPEMDGIQLCTHVKSDINTSHIPVIILSAKVDVSEQLEGLQVGADDYIPKPFSLMIVKTKIHNILRTHRMMIARYKTAKKIEPPKLTVNTIDEQWLEQALKVVNENISNEKFSTDDFARLMLMSRTSLYTKMKALTGESVKEFIRRIRLNRAAELIGEGNLNISEISYQVGFATPSYFTTSFKKHFGCLPTEYQAQDDTSNT